MFSSFIEDDSGSAAVSYGMIISLIVLATILAFLHIGGALTDTFQTMTPSQDDTSPPTNRERVTEFH